MDILKFIVHEVSKDDIVLARDRNGNWLHLNWCRLKYYDKFEGCPNDCDTSFIFDELLDEPYILVGAKCDYEKYLETMRDKFTNPFTNVQTWSERKIRIPYLWQKNIDRVLREKTKEVILDYEDKGVYGLDYMTRPEQYGDFVIATMLRLGYEIELKPEKILWKINLVGKSLSGTRQKKMGEY